jgi:hypothetical protein
MLSRPAVQEQRLVLASTPSNVFTGWSDDNLYVAFKLSGLSHGGAQWTRNFVEYQFRRAWGEDLCQLLIQPMYADGSVGPVLHVVCKPNGSWVERKGDPRRDTDAWPPFEGAGVRYFGTVDGDAWRGEVAIPWRAITDDATGTKGRPTMLKFNLTQHRAETGESASWAGPIDFGRDDSLTGLLFMRDSQPPGIAGGTR